MRRAATVLSLLIFPALAGCAPAPPVRPGPAAMQHTADPAAAISALRARVGAPPVRGDPRLAAAAAGHAADLARSGATSHRGSDGSGLAERLERAGIKACRAAENVARGTGGMAATLAAWLASRGHRRNLLNRHLDAIGMARAGDVWVLVLAARGC